MDDFDSLIHSKWESKCVPQAHRRMFVIVDHKIKTTGFSRSPLAARICCARGGAAWTTDKRFWKSLPTFQQPHHTELRRTIDGEPI